MSKLIDQLDIDTVERLVPDGEYCYKWVNTEGGRRMKTCPFLHEVWESEVMFCSLVDDTDVILLDIGCKICGVNEVC